jgi:hypothetical protein
LGGTLFVLTHFYSHHPTITTHPTCVFHMLVDDTHIVGPITCGFYFFVFIINAFSATSKMCNLVSTRVGPLYETSSWFFFILNPSFHFLGAHVRSKSFVGLFVAKAFHEDFGTIFSLPMLINP